MTDSIKELLDKVSEMVSDRDKLVGSFANEWTRLELIEMEDEGK